MRHRYLEKYSLEYVSEVMKHSPQVGEAYYWTLQWAPVEKQTSM
jgi:hypothetical protein